MIKIVLSVYQKIYFYVKNVSKIIIYCTIDANKILKIIVMKIVSFVPTKIYANNVKKII